MEVAAIGHGMGGVSRSQHIEHQVFGTVHPPAVVDDHIAHKPLYHVAVLEVGLQVHMTANPDIERILGQSQPAHIHMGEVAGKGTLHHLAVGITVVHQVAVYQRIGTGQRQARPAASQSDRSCDFIEMVGLIAQLPDVYLGL